MSNFIVELLLDYSLCLLPKTRITYSTTTEVAEYHSPNSHGTNLSSETIPSRIKMSSSAYPILAVLRPSKRTQQVLGLRDIHITNSRFLIGRNTNHPGQAHEEYRIKNNKVSKVHCILVKVYMHIIIIIIPLSRCLSLSLSLSIGLM